MNFNDTSFPPPFSVDSPSTLEPMETVERGETLEFSDPNDLGVLGHATDIGMGAVRGVAEAGASVYNMVDAVGEYFSKQEFLPDAPYALGLGKSKTVAGALATGVFQFATGFVPAFALFGKLGRVAQLGNVSQRLAKASKSAAAAGKLKKARNIRYSAEFGRSMLAGAAADFAVFDPQEERLSNLIQQFPALRNPVTEILAADKDDRKGIGALKNVVEGALLGPLFEPLVWAIRAIRRIRKAKQAGEPIDKVMDELHESKVNEGGEPTEIGPLQDMIDESPHSPKFEMTEEDLRLERIAEEQRDRMAEGRGVSDLDETPRTDADPTYEELHKAVTEEESLADVADKRTPEQIAQERKAAWEEKKGTVNEALYNRGFSEENVVVISRVGEAISERGGEVSSDGFATLYYRTDKAEAQKVKDFGTVWKHGPVGRKAVDGMNTFHTTPPDRLGGEVIPVKVPLERIGSIAEPGPVKVIRATKNTPLIGGKKNLAVVQRHRPVSEKQAAAGFDPKGEKGKKGPRHVTPEGRAYQSQREAYVRQFHLPKRVLKGDDTLINKALRGDREKINELADLKNKAKVAEARAAGGSGGRGVPPDEGTAAGAEGRPPSPEDEVMGRMMDKAFTAKNPREGAIFNWERMGRSANKFKAQVANADNLEDIQVYEVFDMDDMVEEAHRTQYELKEFGIDTFSPEQIENFNQEGTLKTVLARQLQLRGILNEYSRVVSSLSQLALPKGEGPVTSAFDLAKFFMGSGEAEKLMLLAKRTQEKIGQLLKSQDVVAPDMGVRGEILDSLRSLDDGRAVQEFFTRVGGGDYNRGVIIAEKKLRRYQAAEAAAMGTDAAVKHLVDNPTGVDRFVEYWLNGILSGPITHAVNMSSNAINTFALVGEKFAGGALTFDTQEMREAVSMFTYVFQQAQDALKAATIAFKTETDALDPMFRSHLEIAGKAGAAPDRALRSDNPVLDYVGQFLNLPSRLLLTSDVFFRTMNYRAMVTSKLWREAIDMGEGADWVARRFDRIVQDGQFYSYQNLRLKAEKAAFNDPSVQQITEEGERNVAISRKIYDYMHSDETGWDETLGGLAKEALEYARTATWTKNLSSADRDPLVRLFGDVQRLSNDWPLTKLITPFFRTPVNLAAHFSERMVGAWAELGKRGYKGELGRLRKLSDQAEAALGESGETSAELAGRAFTGFAIMSSGVIAYQNGLINGGGPADPEVASLWRAAGNIPYSFKIPLSDNTIYNLEFKRFDPWAPVLGVIADIGETSTQIYHRDDDMTILEGLTGSMVTAFSNAIGNRHTLVGMARLSQVLADPARYADSYIKQQSTTLGPYNALFRQVLNPETEKETRDVLDAVRVVHGLTGESSDLFFGGEVQPSFNVLGKEIPRPQMNPMFPMMRTLTYTGTGSKEDRILQEMVSHGHGYEPVGEVYGGNRLDQFHDENGVSAETQFNRLMGTVRIGGRTLVDSLDRMMNTSDFKRASPEKYAGGKSVRVEMFRNMIRKYRAVAWDELLELFPMLNQANTAMAQIKDLHRAGSEIPEELLALLA